MSWFLIARVVLIVAAVAIPALHVIVIIVIVIEEVGAFVGGRDACANAVLGQRGGDLHAIAFGFCFSGQDLFPVGDAKNTDSGITTLTLQTEPMCLWCAVTMTFLPDDFYIFTVLALAVPPFTVHNRGVHISRRKGIRFIQQRYHTQQNSPARQQ